MYPIFIIARSGYSFSLVISKRKMREKKQKRERKDAEKMKRDENEKKNLKKREEGKNL